VLVVVGIGHLTDALLIGALFFVGTEITRETLKELRLSAVLHGLALWALMIPAVLVAVIAWVPWQPLAIGPKAITHDSR
jgi:ABC-type branched-subunit amino acid transport system permease subunit